ncbi:MAG: A24 family peptidase [Thermaerobacter sp.]|nr:A24 family peptidase [Thermaerobacter sp.]
MLMTVLAVTVLLAAVCDLRERRIPNWLTGAGFALAAVLRALEHPFPLPLEEGFLGALMLAVPFFLVWLVNREAIGMGDVKLLAAVGVALGPRLGPDALMAAGAAFVLWLAGRLAVNRRPEWRASVPMAPFLAAGVVMVIAASGL